MNTPSAIAAALRANAVPALLLSAFAAALTVAYHRLPAVAGALDAVAGWKERLGFAFAMASTALSGGTLPVLLQLIARRTRGLGEWRHLPFYTVFWAVKGLEVDLLYRGQALLFGRGTDAPTIAKKVALDMGLYVPLWGVPCLVLAYLFKESRYDLRATARALGRNWYRRRVVPLLLANWLVWVPAVALIYRFPLPLQLPIQNIVLCFFALMLLLLTKEAAPSADQTNRSPATSG